MPFARWKPPTTACTRMCRPSRSLSSGLKSLSNSALQYLIADLHLDGKRPETTRLFLDFIDGPAREAARLYILGDLFEAWIGDDAAGRLGRQVANRLASLSRAGTRIYLLRSEEHTSELQSRGHLVC